MKKQYIKPTSAVYNVELQGMIAASGEVEMKSTPARSEYDAESDERGSWGSLW